MDPLTSAALLVVLVGAFLYVLYWVIRRAVAAGIKDAATKPTPERRP
ncbi:hypothetical protein [Frigoribacterium sp. VKM Ac-2836]|nr:hypothetical protein [Frigoribacterium sp. VKM Ac-2836]NRD27977.1 hypothetical protein [Frigoribacterium sp. VKM Ac-2836]